MFLLIGTKLNGCWEACGIKICIFFKIHGIIKKTTFYRQSKNNAYAEMTAI